MIRIFRNHQPDIAPVRVGRVPRGGVVTEVPEFDSINAIGIEGSAPDKNAERQMVRQRIAQLAERGTLSGAAGAILDYHIECRQLQWDKAAYAAYIADQAHVNPLISSQAGEHADRVMHEVAELHRRLADARAAHAVAYFELTGDELKPDMAEPGPVALPSLLAPDARAPWRTRLPEAQPSQPNLIAIPGSGG